MRVDAPGLIAAAQRLLEAVATVGGGGVAHPPLAADPASVGAAGRLTTAGAELTAALAAQMTALVGTVEALTGAALMFKATNDHNAAMLATLSGNSGGPPLGGVWAPPAPPVPPDVRAPLPPPMAGPPEAISAAAHAGDPGAGEPFTTAWAQVHLAARDAASAIRSTVSQLPDTLDAPMSTPAVSRHLLSFADGLDSYADRAHNLVVQATAYAGNQVQAREAIPTPQQLAAAEQNVRTMQANNLATGGKLAVPLAQAVAAKTALNTRVVNGYSDYHASTDAATGGQDPGDLSGDQSGDPTTVDPAAGGPGGPDRGAAPSPDEAGLSPDKAGEMASILPQMMSAVLGAAGGLAGGVLGAVTKVPDTLMQAATQAAGSAAQGLQGLEQPKLDSPDGKPGAGDGAGGPGGPGDVGGGGGGGDAAVTPASRGAPPLSVAPSTGSPPTPAVAPAGAAGPPAPPGAGAGGGSGMAMPMGMPMGGLGGLGGGGAKSEPTRPKKVVVPPIPHTEDVTGRVDTDRLSAAAAATRARIADPPDNDDNPPSSGEPIVRRLVTRPPEEPT